MATKRINIYGEIGKAVTVESVRKQLDPKASSYELHISSVGGDVFDGYTIYNILRNTGKEITTVVEGLCASIATLIAAAGSKIIMNKTSQFMIHNPQISNMAGDAKELRAVADQLDKIKTLLIGVYQQRTGLTTERLWQMYDNETWLTAEEAKGLGFIDEVPDSLKAVASADIKKYVNMEATNSILEKVEGMFNKIVNILRPKNQVTETLNDGTVIVVMTDDDDWTGKSVTTQDGQPLAPGEYTLATGKVIVVGEGSTISEVREAEAPENDTPPTTEDAETENMIKAELEKAQAKIKELESALEARNAAVETAQNEAKKFQNALNTDLKELREELKKYKTTTVGDDKAPDLGVKKVLNSSGQPEYDPMGEDYKNFMISRNF